MNKKIWLISAMILSSTAVLFNACKDDDTTPPVITINGDENMTIELQEGYTELGAVAVDDEDGTVTVSTSGTVNDDQTGEYTITYTASDGEGNTNSVDRIVTVINSADFLGGQYINAKDSCQSSPPSFFDATVTPSDTENGKFTVNNFGAFGTNVNVVCKYNSDGTITAATPQSLGTPALLTLVYSASEVISESSPTQFVIVYQWNDGSSSETCLTTYTR